MTYNDALLERNPVLKCANIIITLWTPIDIDSARFILCIFILLAVLPSGILWYLDCSYRLVALKKKHVIILNKL